MPDGHPDDCNCPEHGLGVMTLDEYCAWEEAQIKRNMAALREPVVDIELARAWRNAKEWDQ